GPGRARRPPLGSPGRQVGRMIKADVPSRARAALRRVEQGEAAPEPVTERRARRAGADDAPSPAVTPSSRGEIVRSMPGRAEHGVLARTVLLDTVVCLLLLGWSIARLWRRSRGGG